MKINNSILIAQKIVHVNKQRENLMNKIYRIKKYDR